VALPDVSRLDRNPGAALAARFRAIGLTRDYIRGMTERGDDLRTPLTPSRAALYSDDAAALALRLFLCGEQIPREAAEACLGDTLCDSAIACGLVTECGEGALAAPFHLRTVHGLYLFSDYLGADGDAVMGAGETTAILFRASLPARPVARVLDLGCGAGTLALLLAAHAREAVGTDINSRAIALARLNASVNGIGNAVFRTGDVWEPAGAETFDLIVSQPPYYPKRTARGSAGDQVFLHGGERGDELSLRVVEGVPAHLAPGGRAVIFTSWPEAGERSASPTLQVLELRTDRRELHGTRQSINVIEHAPGGEGWHAFVDVPADAWGSVTSGHIDRLLAAERLLRGPRAHLLETCLRVPEGAVPFREGDQMLLACPPESLAGMAAVDDRTWEILSAIDRAPNIGCAIETLTGAGVLEVIANALRRGLLALANPQAAQRHPI
jgi:SAM-dependent methyltransferase